MAAQEAELLQLRQKVEGLPKELDSAVQKAIKETSERLRLEAKNREELLVKEFTGDRNQAASVT